MPRINIELPEELHKQLKIHAIENGKSLKEHVIELLRQALQKERDHASEGN